MFVVRFNACLGIDFVLFILDIFVVSLGCLFLYYKNVRFLVSLVFIFALFPCLWVSGLRLLGACLRMHNFVHVCRLEVCVRIQLAHVCRLMYVHTYFKPKALIRVFMFLFLYFLVSYASILVSFYVFESLFLCLIVCLPLTC